MTVVVFDHTPHDGSPFLLQFLAATNLSSFFFISGYLKKPIASQKEALNKYFYCLIIPYFIYNAFYFPYWAAKYYIENGGINFEDCIKPIIGTFLGQLNSNFSCELNGVTWFLISLFIMHLVTDICNRRKKRRLLMAGISFITIILYGANKYYHFAPYLAFHGLVRCISFFFMGYQFRQMDWSENVCVKKDLSIGILTLLLSLSFFYWHIHEDNFVIHIILYFVVNGFSVFGFIYLFRSLDSIKLRFVTIISIATMLIFGLHRILIGLFDFTFEKLLNITIINYNWYEGVCLAFAIEIILLPFILFVKSHYPILLGKHPRNSQSDK